MIALALWPEHGPNPEGRQRASSARDDGASANRVQVQGKYSCQRTDAAAGTAVRLHLQRECHSFRLGCSISAQRRSFSALAGDRRELLVDPGVGLRLLEPAG